MQPFGLLRSTPELPSSTMTTATTSLSHAIQLMTAKYDIIYVGSCRLYRWCQHCCCPCLGSCPCHCRCGCCPTTSGCEVLLTWCCERIPPSSRGCCPGQMVASLDQGTGGLSECPPCRCCRTASPVQQQATVIHWWWECMCGCVRVCECVHTGTMVSCMLWGACSGVCLLLPSLTPPPHTHTPWITCPSLGSFLYINTPPAYTAHITSHHSS